jgi:hypothetical protein
MRSHYHVALLAGCIVQHRGQGAGEFGKAHAAAEIFLVPGARCPCQVKAGWQRRTARLIRGRWAIAAQTSDRRDAVRVSVAVAISDLIRLEGAPANGRL